MRTTTPTERPRPTLGRFEHLAAAGVGTCAAAASGEVLCWGDPYRVDAGSVAGRAGVRRLDLGGELRALVRSRRMTAALRLDGELWWWRGLSGPAAHVSLPDAVRIALVGDELCVQRKGGEVRCGALRDDRFDEQGEVPAARGAIDLVGAGERVCALSATGTASCWRPRRSDDAEVVWSDVRAFVATPTGEPLVVTRDGRVPGALDGLPQLSAAVINDHGSCGKTSDGSVVCWRHRGEPPIGVEPHEWFRTLALPGPIRTLAAGDRHMCVLTESGEVWCWGSNDRGQIGDGGFAVELAPTRVEGAPQDLRVVVMPTSATCALDERGAVSCWGRDMRWETPRVLPDAPPLRQLTAAGDGICGLTDRDALVCGRFAADDDTLTWTTSRPLREQMKPLAIAATPYWVCVGGDTSLGCWQLAARDEGLQLGDESLASRPSPLHQLAARSSFLHGVDADGHILLWQAAPNTKPPALSRVQKIADVTACHEVVAGFGRLCSRCGVGEVRCSGIGFEPTTAGPRYESDRFITRADGLAVARRLKALDARELGTTTMAGRYAVLVGGEAHMCGLRSDQRVLCWGDNSWGQLGDGTGDAAWQPVEVAGLADPVTELWSGLATVCARTMQRELYCWGLNDHGQVGSGRSGRHLRPRRFDPPPGD
ncbi:RCC1 domain-containing protein [Nannocystis pusilla]|uniref:RCC1 domain-containing protein n=1 Tax=Nannocystis pusilla TaxID=889268 RepID=UPI003DA44866